MKTTPKSKTPKREKPFRIISTTYIAGVQYGDYAPGMFPDGDVRVKLQLVREPSNPRDPNAIKVMFGKAKLGYIARKHTAAIHAEAVGQPRGTVHAVLIRHDKQSRLWEKLVVQVRTFNVNEDEF